MVCNFVSVIIFEWPGIQIMVLFFFARLVRDFLHVNTELKVIFVLSRA